MIVKTMGEAEIVIEKSRFISFLMPIDSEAQGKEILLKMRKQYHDATHVCYAMRYADIERSNDDGEPSGTAGMPLLTLLKNKDIEEVLLVVVRYFGGIKLGKGGLVHAYGNAGMAAVEHAVFAQKIIKNKYIISLPYSLGDRVRSYLEKNEALITYEYGEEVSFTFAGDETLLQGLAVLCNAYTPKKIGTSIFLDVI